MAQKQPVKLQELVKLGAAESKSLAYVFGACGALPCDCIQSCVACQKE
jgi:hypothetical protein